MNNERRKRITAIRDQLDSLKSDIEGIAEEERDYISNMPENMQQGEKGQAAEEKADALEAAANSLDEALSSLDDAAS